MYNRNPAQVAGHEPARQMFNNLTQKYHVRKTTFSEQLREMLEISTGAGDTHILENWLVNIMRGCFGVFVGVFGGYNRQGMTPPHREDTNKCSPQLPPQTTAGTKPKISKIQHPKYRKTRGQYRTIRGKGEVKVDGLESVW